MLKNYVNTINYGYERQVSQALKEMCSGRGFSAPALVAPSGFVEYSPAYIVLCDSLQDMFNIINAIFVRLHKATCRLIGWRSGSVELTKPLPDILKDLNSRKMEQISTQPDILCNSPRKHIIHHNRRSASDFHISIYSRRDHGTNSHINHAYGRYHQLPHSSINTCLHDNKIEGNGYLPKRHQHNYDIRDAQGTYISDQRTVRAPVPNESDRSRLLYTQNNIPLELFDANRSQGFRHTSSKGLHSSQRSSENSNHRQAVTYQWSHHNNRSSYYELSREEMGNSWEQAAVIVNAQTQQMSEQCDPEVLKDIVRTLRIVGDDLDIKMRNYKQPFHKAVLCALRTNTGQLLLATVKQFNLVGVAIEASLSLLKLLSQ